MIKMENMQIEQLGFHCVTAGKIPIRSATAFSSLSLRGRPRAEGAEQAPVERSACKGNFHWKIPATQKKGDRSLHAIK